MDATKVSSSPKQITSLTVKIVYVDSSDSTLSATC
jgi:hypothetical protein